MSRTRRRHPPTLAALTRPALVGAVLFAAPALVGCEAGMNAQTAQQYGPVDAATARAQALRIQNAFLAPPTGSALAAGSDARLFFTVVNPTDDDDRLVRVDAREARTARLSGAVVVPAHTLVTVGSPPRTVTLAGLSRQLRPGQTLDVTLAFARAGTVSLTVPVELKEGPAATIVPETPPAPT
ncbi:MAG TPA: copper chaperone PCu(A)C, partial [Mycobacteriales bacterium]|nr:copper chaperone PCu(A)C [Mycobacteriales bacterium]